MSAFRWPRACRALPFLLALGCHSSADDDVLIETPAPSGTSPSNTITLGQLTQPVEHTFAMGPTFQQRYFLETDQATGPDAPILLYVGGESELVGTELLTITDLATRLGANMVSLEHRYYGVSVPDGADATHLAGLTFDNAIEDLASFLRYVRDNLKLTGKVLAIGGSYPGMLAASLRTAHPELLLGAYASSAPVKLAVAYPGYDEVAAAALGPACAASVERAYTAAVAAFADEPQRNALVARYYGAGASDADMSVMLADWSYQVSIDAQYGSTHDLCASLAQYPDSPLDGLLLYLRPPYLEPPTTSTVPQPQAAAGHTPRPDATGVTASLLDAGTAWNWQVCTELGLFQVASADRARSVIWAGLDTAYSVDQCAKTGVHRAPEVVRIRAKYIDPIVAGAVTNIFFTNGSLDPWSGAGFLDPTELPAGKDLSVMVLAEASHAEDLATSGTSGLPAAFEAHARFAAFAEAWLAK